MKLRVAVVLGIAGFLAGCAVGPNYKRPSVATPATFRGADPAGGSVSLADTKWPDLFQDDVLKQLVTTALQDNFDLRIASQRILEARAQLGITRSQLFPTVSASGSFVGVRTSSLAATRFNIPDASYTTAGFNLGWELDVWGRIRRLTEAARAQFFATEEARRGVVITLVADVTTAYFELRELDLELTIAKQTLEIAQNGLRLTTVRRNNGAATGLDVHQAEQFLYTASAQIAATERAIAQTENAINLLLGKSPADVARGKALNDFAVPSQVPPGLPSALLERRPDIRAAEQNLIAANAEIGAAKAQYFPQITLTGLLGAQSRALSDLFTGPARSWNFAPAAAVPIFNAGRLRNNVRLTEALKEESVIGYQKAIQTSFREVADSLAAYQKTGEQRKQQELLVTALRETERLSTLRYRGGLDSYLQVLDADRNLFQGQLALAQLQREELLSVVQLYRSLGGGWQQ
ncbi:MAG: efflux transporter outer membrane subunit [Bryobacteraceae bacterium]